MATEKDLTTAYYDNVRNTQIGGVNDGISPSEAKDLGYETPEDMARILGAFSGVATTSEVEAPGVSEGTLEEVIPNGPRQLPQAAIDAVAAARANRSSLPAQTQSQDYITRALRGHTVDARRRGKH